MVLALLLASTACASPPAIPDQPTATSAAESSATALEISPTSDAATAVPEATSTTVPPSPSPTPKLAAMVNGQPVYLTDYERELGRYEASLEAQGIDPSSPEGQQNLAQARAWVLDVMIEQVLIEQAAEEAGVVVSQADVDEEMEDLIAENGGEEKFRAKLKEWGETYEDARREVRAQLIGMAMTERIVEAVPETAEHIRARHILVDTLQEAERIHAQLETGADFAALAKAHSQDESTRKSGGDLGFFPRGILMAPEVEEAAFALQPGEFSDVIESSLGYHIVKVVERDPDRPIGPENLRIMQDQAIQEWIEGLWAEADVERLIDTAP